MTLVEALAFLDILRAQPLYAQLVDTYTTVEGTLLERQSDGAIAAQLSTLCTLMQTRYPRVIVEIGTAKGFLGFVLGAMGYTGILWTIDHDPRSADAIAKVQAAFPRMRVTFHLGDSRTRRSVQNPLADFAWVDGGHDEATALHDITLLMEQIVPCIAIDDAGQMASVQNAIATALQRFPRYAALPRQYDEDQRGIVVLCRGDVVSHG